MYVLLVALVIIVPRVFALVVLLYHWYVIVPVPVAVTLNAGAVPPAHTALGLVKLDENAVLGFTVIVPIAATFPQPPTKGML